MFKRWRCYVALLLCLCCTFATLSLNTLQVKAGSNDYRQDFSSSFTIYPSDSLEGTQSFSFTNNGSYGSGTIANYGVFRYYNFHFKIPFNMKKSWLDSQNDADKIYRVLISGSGSSSSSVGTISNIGIYESSGDLLFSSWNGYCIKFYKGSELHQIIDGNDFGLSYPLYIEFDWSYQDTRSNNYENGVNVTFNFNGFRMYIQDANSQEIESYKTQTSDKGTQQKLDTQISQEQTAQSTRTGILNQITSFFGSFFENIINTLKSLFIPEDGYFTNWFTRLNDLLSAKLGMLYAPFDLVISVLTALGSASTSEAGIPFPELAWDGQVIIPAQTFYFSSLGSSFNDLRDAVYFGTDVVLLFAFLVLLQRKINLVMRGSEEG